MGKITEKAIFYPFFEKNTFLIFMGVLMFLLFFMGFIFPEKIEDRSFNYINELFFNITDVRNMALKSDFPFVTAAIYFIVLILSPIFAIILCFTKGDIDSAKKHLPDTFFKRVLLVLIVLIICLSPYLFEMNSNMAKFRLISEIIENYKIAFLIYAEIMFILYVLSWAFLLGVVAEFFKFLVGSKQA